MRMSSLRFRTTSWYVGLLALSLFAFGTTVFLSVRKYLDTSLDRHVQGIASAIAQNYMSQLGTKSPSWVVGEIRELYLSGRNDRFIRISSGTVILYQSGDIQDPLIKTSQLPLPSAPTEGSFSTVLFGKTHLLRVYSLPYRGPGDSPYLIEVAASKDAIQHVLHNLLVTLFFTAPVVLLTAAIGGYLLMSQPLRPVVVLTDQAEHVGKQGLGERLPVPSTGDELERLSLSLNRMIQRLEDALAHNRRFSADASHELRTPLTIVRGELEEIIQMPELPSKAVNGIGSALEEIDRLSGLVHNLLTISRLDCGGEKMEFTPVDLGVLAAVTADQMQLLAEERRVSLICHAEENVIASGDATRLKQIIVNLVDNAIKYSRAGDEVVVDVTSEREYAVLEVRDTGIGIPAAAQPHVFERFYRADKARSRESGGAGLGLSIVQAICSAHAGSVSLTSNEGEGTTVRVKLPLFPNTKESEQIKIHPQLTAKREIQYDEGHVDTEIHSITTKS